MALTLSNQKPVVLDPVHTIPVAGDYDPVAAAKAAIVDPIFTPLTTGGTVSLTDASNSDWTQDDLIQLFMLTQGETVDMRAEDEIRPVFEQALVSYDAKTPLLTNSLFAVQAGCSLRPALPHPGPTAVYTAHTDVVPSAKKMLAGTGTEAEFFASLAYTFAPETLGFWFQTETAFEEFKTWLGNQTQTLSALLPQPTVDMLNKFQTLKLNVLTEGLVLRSDANDGNDEYSFARVIVHMLMAYLQQQRNQHNPTGSAVTAGLLPFHTGELFIPTTIVLVNVEIHARSRARKVENEWKLINATLNSGVKVVSTKALSKLTALPRAAAKAAAQAANAATNRGRSAGRSASIKFRKTPPKGVDLTKGVLKALAKMKQVSRSQNTLRTISASYLKASRRDPDDYNRPGRLNRVVYLPDLHIYLDCSGSISESDYQEAVIMLIKMAKKLNVNLYFSSFSHVLSQEVMLKTAGKSVNAIWEEFRRIPKVDGGTSYDQIWRYIEASEKRKTRLSLILTDFEWTPGTRAEPHPKNLYYAPIATANWPRLVHWAQNYCRSMAHIEPAIAQRMIGVIV